jgi:GH15 family glucan-1,4-alpha-glucosidase
MSATATARAAQAADMPHVLREYALLADGERGVLVSPRGDFAWMCFPRWDSDALFSSLIGGGGTYMIAPAERFVWGGYYEPGSLIWRSRWTTPHSTIECREALALPGDARRAIVLRQVIAVEGTARLEIELGPRAQFGQEPLTDLALRDDGAWTARVGETTMLWSGAQQAVVQEDPGAAESLALEIDLEEGSRRDFVLVLAGAGATAEAPDPHRAWRGVEAEWQSRVPPLEDSVGRRDARHAYAVVSGLTSSSGGMVAAATTSVPERAREGRSFDYRYAWIRDQCYTGQAIARAGPHALMDDAVNFVTARLLEDGPGLMPAYTAAGGRVPDESKLGVPGYPGGSGVVGNWVNRQFQLDVFGEALLLFAAAAQHDHLGADGWHAAEVAVQAIASRWRESDSDAGVWEVDPDAWTHSRLICAAGLGRIAAVAPATQQVGDWLSLADQIISDASARALHPSGRWQRSPTDERCDAALLLPAIRGAIPAEDPRSIATLRAVEAELTEDGFCYRYRPDERPLGEAEGAFLLCGFWMALSYAQQDKPLEAARWFERNRAACGPPGLYSEEYDVTQRQLRGNLPQAFVHALLFECAAGGLQ